MAHEHSTIVLDELKTNLVFYSITPLSQHVIFEIQELKARMHILDELSNLERTLVIPQSDRVPGKSSLENFS